MPPRSYVIIAILLAVLVAVSIPLTLGFSVILWYWLFAAAACILAVVGVFRVVDGLHAPLWIGVALALPGFVWAANRLYELTSSVGPQNLRIFYALTLAAYVARLAAALGALRLIEIMSTPHAAFRVGYGVLAASALLVAVGWAAYAAGWTFTHNAFYATPARALGVAAKLIECGAFIGVAVVITTRRSIEWWAGAAMSLISAYMLYKAMTPMFLVGIPGYRGDGPLFWMEPVIMLVGGAAVWRMGSVLRAQAHLERSAQSLAIANAPPSSSNAGL